MDLPEREQRMLDTAKQVADFAYKQGVGDAVAVDDLIREYRALRAPERGAVDSVNLSKREALALGWLTAELAVRAHGHTPDWFPEPSEWLELWRRALAATAASARRIEPTPSS